MNLIAWAGLALIVWAFTEVIHGTFTIRVNPNAKDGKFGAPELPIEWERPPAP